MSRIRNEYVEKGHVRLVYKQFPILGQESLTAAEASECAAEQDGFWEYHDRVFEDQATKRSSLTTEKLVGFAGDIGLDEPSFQTCLSEKRHTDTIYQEASMIQSLGIRGTPAFLLNGQFISGAQPFEVFQKIIDAELEN